MQYLNSYFPVMPTWTNIQSVMVVQPNGTILSQYRQISDHHRKKLTKSSSHSDQESSNSQQKEKKTPNLHDIQKRQVKQKLKNVSKQVIEASRKLFRDNYQKQLNRLIVDKSLIYYQFRYNILVIVVVKKFSVDVQQIKELITKVFNWYSQKCISMNIQMSIPNVSLGIYQLGQFKKLQWEIAHQIDQKVSTSQFDKSPTLPKQGQQEFIKERLQRTAQTIINREQKLKEMAQKVSFVDEHSQTSSRSKPIAKPIFLVKMVQKVIPGVFKEKQKKHRKFTRQFSFMQNSLQTMKYMKVKVILCFVCLFVSFTLGMMVYFGWFQGDSL